MPAVVSVSAIATAVLHLNEHRFIAGVTDEDKSNPCPSLAFLIRHLPTNRLLLFDLGVRKDLDAYPPAVQERLRRWPVEPLADVPDTLVAHGIDPAAIDYVVLSHLHWDHAGDPRPYLNATFVLGSGGRCLVDPGGHPRDPTAPPLERTLWVDAASWAPWGPFPRALDFFGDGSLFLVDAPGHLPGHLNVLARIGDGAWVCLAGDSTHDVRVLRGEAQTAGGAACSHADLAAAEAHLARLRLLMAMPRVQVIIAHDYQWPGRHPNAFLPGHIEPTRS